MQFGRLTCVVMQSQGLQCAQISSVTHCTPVQGQDIDMWQPETWVQLLQPIVNFVNQVVQRFGCNTQEQLLQMQQHVAKLQQAVENFRKLDRCSGDNSIVNNLCNLERQVQFVKHDDRAAPKFILSSTTACFIL